MALDSGIEVGQASDEGLAEEEAEEAQERRDDAQWLGTPPRALERLAPLAPDVLTSGIILLAISGLAAIALRTGYETTGILMVSAGGILVFVSIPLSASGALNPLAGVLAGVISIVAGLYILGPSPVVAPSNGRALTMIEAVAIFGGLTVTLGGAAFWRDARSDRDD